MGGQKCIKFDSVYSWRQAPESPGAKVNSGACAPDRVGAVRLGIYRAPNGTSLPSLRRARYGNDAFPAFLSCSSDCGGVRSNFTLGVKLSTAEAGADQDEVAVTAEWVMPTQLLSMMLSCPRMAVSFIGGDAERVMVLDIVMMCLLFVVSLMQATVFFSPKAKTLSARR